MSRAKLLMLVLLLSSATMMSLPFLVPHAGWVALFGLVPLLLADVIADNESIRHYWIWVFVTFCAWNFATTFWVCNATIGGGIFASIANALQMTLIYSIARATRGHLGNTLSLVFLAVMWIAWERAYFSWDISWPWLTLGNAFARSTDLVQWYEYTGTLGGSLWIWICNLGLFGLIVSLADGAFARMKPIGKVLSIGLYFAVVALPIIWSEHTYRTYEEDTTESLAVVIGQPNFDPYQKFESMTQEEQTASYLELVRPAMDKAPTSESVLLLAPETFTADIISSDIQSSRTYQSFESFMQSYPNATLLFGASTRDVYYQYSRPTPTAREVHSGIWVQPHNAAITLSSGHAPEVYNKNKLVVGVESTPYPRVFVPLDDKLGGVMGRDIGDGEAQVLHVSGTPIGCAICYESVYGEFCADYVRKGAKAMTVITNDAWWGDTPGYRQHLSYSALRAIELRRDIARCANTGISAIINQRGDIVSQSTWWQAETMTGRVYLNDEITWFAAHGDAVGRICTFAFLLLLLAWGVRVVIKR